MPSDLRIQPATTASVTAAVFLPPGHNSFQQPQRAWVVFADETNIAWLRWLKHKFRHCFVLINDGDHWIALEPLASCLEVSVLPPAPDFNLPAWLEAQHHVVCEAPIRRHLEKMAPLAPLNCVEIVKRYLGIRDPFILTPYHLYRYLTTQQLRAATTVRAERTF